MQFTKPFKEAIRAGRVTCTVRAWRSPRARVGGRYTLHPHGAVEVTGITRKALSAVTRREIQRSGFTDAEALRDYLGAEPDDAVYAVTFRYLGDEPAAQPDTRSLDADGLHALAERLERMDRRSSRGRWTRATLALIADRPGTRAADLAARLGWETAPFKANVRKLKGLGLTESLETGYRLTRRGRQVLAAR